MRAVVPAVERVVDVPSSVSLPELHDVLQVALGWTDSHLHQFIAGGLRYGVPHVDDFDEERDEAGVRLADLPTRFGYVYDFGDVRHEALIDQVEVRDLCRWAVAAA